MARRESSGRSWSSRSVALVAALLTVRTLLSPALAAESKPKNRDPKEEAAAISQVADAKNTAGDYAMCGDLFQQAYRTDPSYLGYLFSAARCEQKAGQLDAAERDFRLFLARCPQTDKLVEKAKKFLDEILEERKKVAVAKVEPSKPDPAKPDPTRPDLPAPGPGAAGAAATGTAPAGTAAGAVDAGLRKGAREPAPRLAPWAATLGGAAVLVAGGAVMAVGLSQRADLRDQLTPSSPGGLIVGVTPQEARSRQSAAQNWVTAGAVGIGLGAVALGLGAWWLSSGGQPAPDQAAAWQVAPWLDVRGEGVRGGAVVQAQF